MAKHSGQSGRKILPRRKKNPASYQLCLLEGILADEDLVICVKYLGKYATSLICTELERIKGEKLIF
jgi:hypothetical protein